VGSKTCSTSKTTCVLKGVKKGRHRVSVTASRKGFQVTTSQIVVLR
jgi:hypothetical protein